ncbi:MAG: cupin domain-containing protein [Bacteroidetes bacterium]|nr:cupin domain-containing protein [Bacteroidota bacterium]
MNIPSTLSSLFSDENFANYPKVLIPQIFNDDRGSIKNLADGRLGDVAIISSQKSSIRANHVHENDWHFSYLVSGQMRYFWKDSNRQVQSLIVKAGEMVYTPPKIPHKMQFLEESVFIAISELSRSQNNYEADTKKMPENFFVM